MKILEQVEANVAVVKTEVGSVHICVGNQLSNAFENPEAAQNFARELQGVDFLPSAEEQLAMYYSQPYDLY